MSDSEATATQHPRFVLDEDKPLSQSVLWEIQRTFFDRQGIEAWSTHTVPHYITNNPFIAGAYARVVAGFLQDWAAASPPALERSQPLYIIELGTGAGRFSYLFLKQFLKLTPRPALPFTYVMTDFAEHNVRYWQHHPALQPFVEKGLLDFARFDLEQAPELTLIHSGARLAANTVKNPVVVLANYFFACLPQDIFWVGKGELYESRPVISSAQPEPDLSDPELLSRLRLIYKNLPITPDYYDDPAYNQILRVYHQELTGTAIRLPVGALGYCRLFQALSQGRLLLLLGDKGYGHKDGLSNQGPPGYSIHGGSFSMNVDLNAIGEYFRYLGGEMLLTTHHAAMLNVVAYLLGNPPANYAATRRAYKEAIERFGPDDFFMTKQSLEQRYEQLSIAQLLALLKLGNWDPRIMAQTLHVFMKQVASATVWQKQEIYRAIEQVWGLYYDIGERYDFAFHLALLLFKMKYYPEAATYFQRSLAQQGADPATYYNLALCHQNLRQLDEALRYARQTLTLNPAHESARAMVLQLQAERQLWPPKAAANLGSDAVD